MQDFSKDKIGTPVWDFNYGWGNITDIDDGMYPIGVSFVNCNFRQFTDDGREDINRNQTLFYDEIKFEIPLKPLPKLEIDTKVIVWDDDEHTKSKRYFSNFNKNGHIMCFRNGATSWSEEVTTMWDNWKLAEVGE